VRAASKKLGERGGDQGIGSDQRRGRRSAEENGQDKLKEEEDNQGDGREGRGDTCGGRSEGKQEETELKAGGDEHATCA